MNLFLPSLYQEFQDLSAKLNRVSDLITMYGGQPPNYPSTLPPPVVSQPIVTTTLPSIPKPEIKHEKSIPLSIVYPTNGSWKEKILFILSELNVPSTGKDIAQGIVHAEQTDDVGQIQKTVSQYTSTLSKSGIIGVDDTNFRHKYFLVS